LVVMADRQRFFAMAGGLDQVSPALGMSAGRVRASMNYEPVVEGYACCDGYERYDGRAAPSQATVDLLEYTAGQGGLSAGDIIIGSLSGATAVVLVNSVPDAGTWGAGTASGSVALINVVGQFLIGDTISRAGVIIAIAASTSAKINPFADARNTALAIEAQEIRRSLITKVPGDGPVLGGFDLDGTIFAIRKVAGAASAALWRATLNGWVAVQETRRLPFSAGIVEPEEGDVIRGVVGNATATIARVVRQSGDWGSTAAGYLVVTGQVLQFQAETLMVGTTTIASAASGSTLVSLPATGRYRFIRHNFYGKPGALRVYAVNGVGRAFEFDGQVIAPIETGTTVDAPTHVAEHAGHLCLAFAGGSLQVSNPGQPLIWSGETGAAEFALGTEITDLVSATNTALAIFGDQRISILSGSDVDTFQLETLTELDAGAKNDTAQRFLGQTVYFDRRGLRSLSASQDYGNFRTGVMSELVEPLIRAKRNQGTVPVGSVMVRSKSQYRLLWSDGSGINLFMRGRDAEIMPFELGDLRATFVFSCELSDGTEAIIAGGEDGYLYRLDIGCSHDGERINAFCMMAFTHLDMPGVIKRFQAATIELNASPQTNLSMSMQFDYADGGTPADGQIDFSMLAGGAREFIVTGGGGLWDAINWDSFYWSQPAEGEARTYLDGIGRNASLIIASRRTRIEPPHILRSYSISYGLRGGRKGML
jgi:hypothetical protein